MPDHPPRSRGTLHLRLGNIAYRVARELLALLDGGALVAGEHDGRDAAEGIPEQEWAIEEDAQVMQTPAHDGAGGMDRVRAWFVRFQERRQLRVPVC